MVRDYLPGPRAAVVVLSLVAASHAAAQSVVSSKHDFSTSTTNEVCVFCHTPHSANAGVPAPLWNRVVSPAKSFKMYVSDTMDSACAGMPTGPSVACLGCHDGNLASTTHGGYTVGDKHDVVNAPGPGGIPDTTTYPSCERCHGAMYGKVESWRLGGPKRFTGPVDLSNDHPISMTYPTGAQDPAFNAPPDAVTGWAGSGPSGLRLYSGKVECPTCHNVHNPTIAPFLRATNANSALCLTCHVK